MPWGRRSLVEGHASREANVQMMMMTNHAGDAQQLVGWKGIEVCGVIGGWGFVRRW